MTVSVAALAHAPTSTGSPEVPGSDSGDGRMTGGLEGQREYPLARVDRKYHWHCRMEVTTYTVVEAKRARIVRQRMIVVGCHVL